MMKIAEEAKRQFAWTNADGYTDNELAETVSELESIITEKLKPVKELLERIKSDVVCEGIPLKLGYVSGNECSPKMALSSIGEKAVATLALFGDE